MPQKADAISYQASTMTVPLKQLIAEYGDCLELLTAEEKLHLLAILALWQGRDTELIGMGGNSYELCEAVEDYPFQLCGDALSALSFLVEIEVEQVCDLMVAISSQIRNGVFQQ